LIGAGIVLLGSSTAAAQERGQFGLVMGYPTTVGMVWHATDRVGIKAEATFSVTSTELDSALLRELNNRTVGINVAGLFYAGRAENVSLYVSPRFGYAKTVSELEGETFVDLLPIPVPVRDLRNETSMYSFGGLFGSQYSPIRRFSVFGEVGLNYSSQQTESSPVSTGESESSSLGLRSAVGVVLYFN
jgi:hypothetical protein